MILDVRLTAFVMVSFSRNDVSGATVDNTSLLLAVQLLDWVEFSWGLQFFAS